MMDDYINREDAIDVIRGMIVNRPLDSDRYVLSDVKERLRKFPSADVQENVRGEWENKAGWGMSDAIVCSRCNYDSIARYNFCPNCGADMRSEQDDK